MVESTRMSDEERDSEPSGRCRCGSTNHLRVSHHTCPLNKKHQAPQLAESEKNNVNGSIQMHGQHVPPGLNDYLVGLMHQQQQQQHQMMMRNANPVLQQQQVGPGMNLAPNGRAVSSPVLFPQQQGPSMMPTPQGSYISFQNNAGAGNTILVPSGAPQDTPIDTRQLVNVGGQYFYQNGNVLVPVMDQSQQQQKQQPQDSMQLQQLVQAQQRLNQNAINQILSKQRQQQQQQQQLAGPGLARLMTTDLRRNFVNNNVQQQQQQQQTIAERTELEKQQSCTTTSSSGQGSRTSMSGSVQSEDTGANANNNGSVANGTDETDFLKTAHEAYTNGDDKNDRRTTSRKNRQDLQSRSLEIKTDSKRIKNFHRHKNGNKDQVIVSTSASSSSAVEAKEPTNKRKRAKKNITDDFSGMEFEAPSTPPASKSPATKRRRTDRKEFYMKALCKQHISDKELTDKIRIKLVRLRKELDMIKREQNESIVKYDENLIHNRSRRVKDRIRACKKVLKRLARV